MEARLRCLKGDDIQYPQLVHGLWYGIVTEDCPSAPFATSDASLHIRGRPETAQTLWRRSVGRLGGVVPVFSETRRAGRSSCGCRGNANCGINLLQSSRRQLVVIVAIYDTTAALGWRSPPTSAAYLAFFLLWSLYRTPGTRDTRYLRYLMQYARRRCAMRSVS